MGIAVGALICGAAATAFAANDSDRIARIGIAGNVAYLWPADGAWGNLTCPGGNFTIGSIDTSTENGRLVYQTALAAFLAQHTVKAHYTTCDSEGYPRITRVDVFAP